jgi:hypothetical protein
MSLLLFTRDPSPAPAIGGGKSTIVQPPDGSGKSVVPAPVSQSDPFALSADDWRRLAAFANTGLQMRNTLRQFAPRQSALQQLAAAWGPLDGQLDRWGGARDALVGLGKDIIGYARDVAPPLYKRIGEILGKLSDRPDKALEAELRTLLAKATAEADGRAQRAAQWSVTIGPFADTARRFVEVLSANQRNPAIRVQLDEIPYMGLSADGNWLAIAGDQRNAADGRQFWVIEQVAPDGPYTLQTADGSRMLMADRVDGMDRNFPLGNMKMEQVIKEGPRPRLAPFGEVRNRPETEFWFTGDRYIQPLLWPHHTLDCAGDDGWQQGTPVLNWIKNDGRNQKWKVRPRSFWDLHFFDACRTVGLQAGGIPSFQHLQGDWLAISKDLNDGILGVLKGLDTGVPFIAQFDIAATLSAWADVANEAQQATSGL